MIKRLVRVLSVLAAAALFLAGGAAKAAEPVRLTLKDHHFTPQQVTVPSGERFRIEIANQDSTPAEFESSDLRAEKIVVPGSTIIVTAGPLKPGSYHFFDDYNPDTATGTIVAVERVAKD